jgi:hypothetical protein
MRESALLGGCTHSTQETSITHFMPIQFRGPMQNGLSAALLSALKAARG